MSTQTTLFEPGEGGSHVVSQELDVQAHTLLNTLRDVIVATDVPSQVYLPILLASIPEDRRNNTKLSFYLREVRLLGGYHDLLLARHGQPALWTSRCFLAVNNPKKVAEVKFAELLYELQQLMYLDSLGVHVKDVLTVPPFLGWWTGAGPADSVKDLDDPRFLDIIKKYEPYWHHVFSRPLASVTGCRGRQRSPKQHLTAVFKRFGLKVNSERRTRRLFDGTRPSEYTRCFETRNVKPAMVTLYAMQPEAMFQAYVTHLNHGTKFTYLAEAMVPYVDAVRDYHSVTMAKNG